MDVSILTRTPRSVLTTRLSKKILTQICPPHMLLPAPVAIQQPLRVAHPRALGLLDGKDGEAVAAEACRDAARVA
jgi:hypothetical protein